MLLRANAIPCSDINRCAATITQAVGHIPYYIQKLISRMPQSQESSPASIEELLNKEIRTDRNDWDFEHFRTRLLPYYDKDEQTALLILDAVAVGQPLDFQAIRKNVNAQIAVDDERFRHVLKQLNKDHYLTRNEDNQYSFYLELIRRWWVYDRSL